MVLVVSVVPLLVLKTLKLVLEFTVLTLRVIYGTIRNIRQHFQEL